MKKQYSFLKDPRALAEIRKHKWIESQKANREIGFATAAVDWIKNHGQAWKRIHIQEEKDYSIFIERRKYRRFKMEACANLIKESRRFLAHVVNANIFGLLCKSPVFVLPGKKMKLELRLAPSRRGIISCGATIQRAELTNTDDYEIFLELDRYGQKQLALSTHDWINKR